MLTSLSPKSSTEALQLQPTIKNVKPILKNENSPKKGLPVRFALKTLLLDSSLEGDLEQVQKCVENGADINCANEEGLTALHSSSCNGHFEIVKYLVEHGANVNSVKILFCILYFIFYILYFFFYLLFYFHFINFFFKKKKG